MYPIIFKTDFFTLHTYWIFFALAIIAGTLALIKFSVKNSLKLQFLSSHSGKIILLTLIGARVIALIENYRTYFSEINLDTFFRIFFIWDRGLNLWGAVAAFLITFFYLCKKEDQDFWRWLDTIIPALILGLSFANIGAFFEGINYGHETSLPWGVNFESPIIKYAVPIHPTQIYAALYSFALSALLVVMGNSKKINKLKNTGFIGIFGITAYNLLRFLEEFLRGDDTLMILEIRVSQIAALILFIAGSILIYRRYRLHWLKK